MAVAAIAPDRVTADASSGRAGTEATIFWVGFALAAVFHALGSPYLASGWSLSLLGLAAAWVLVAPQTTAARCALAAAVLVRAWFEAPLLGNHWLLASLIALAWLGASAVGRIRSRATDAIWNDFARTARLTLLVAYGFAAFAKLNADFFEPAVSCAGFYLRESAGSIGLDAIADSPTGWIDWVAIFGTVAVELTIPVLLIVRRTRPFGVVVGLAFHFVLAIDRTHQFFDFSSLLTVLFLLFAGASVQESLVTTVRSVAGRLANRWPSAPQRLVEVLAVGVAVALSLPLASDRQDLIDPYRSAGLVAFWVGGFAVLVIVGRATWRARREVDGPPVDVRPVVGLILLVPLLAFANGLTPYTEVKTGYGWNMYSNLRTVDGESNHFIVRATLPLRDQQASLVRVIESSDAGLRFYEQFDYLLTFDRFRDHLSRHPDASVTYERDGVIVVVPRAGDEPGLARALPEVERRLLLFRAVDGRASERCLQGFGPAR